MRMFPMSDPRVVCFLALLIVVTACVSVSKSVLDSTRQGTPIPKENVFVYMASMNDTLPDACSRVAILHASGPSNYTDQGDIVDKLRDEAGKLGANAIVLQSMEEAGTGEQVVSALFGTGTDTDSDALAVWCPEDVIARARGGG